MKGKKKKVNEAVRVAEKAAADTAEVEELASGFGRLQKHGVHIKGRWKSLPITADLLDIDNMSGFVCMEELTDYSVVSQMFLKAEESGNGDLSLTKSAKKRKYEQSLDRQPIESEKIEEEKEKMSEARSLSNIEGGVKKKKRKRNKRKQKALPAKESGNQRADGSWTAKALVVGKKGSEEQMERSSWEGLCVPEPVLQALLELGFSQPTAIQALTLPAAIRDMRDVLGAAETGSGKTLAYGIPVIQRILEWQEARLTKNSESQKEPNDELEIRDSGEDGVELRKNVVSGFEGEPKTPDDETVVHGTSKPLLALVVAPTRELAVQVKHHLDAVAKHTGIRTAVIVGGMAVHKQQRVLNQHPEVVVGTPGRLWQLIDEGHPHLSTFTQLRCLVLDEADRLLEPGHFAELTQLLEFLDASKARGLGHSQHSRQTFVFSATLTLGHATPSRHFVKPKNAPIGKGVPCDGKSKLGELIKRLGIRPSPKIVDLTRKGATAEALTETRLHCDTDEKDLYLYYFLIQYPGRTMVFANSVSCVKRLVSLLSVLGCDVVALHANMHQKQRLKNLERFASRDRCVLLTTDVAARGLDIVDVLHVIHYQVPRTSETYVHRSGRTARATHEGLSLLLIGPTDANFFRRIVQNLTKKAEIPLFPIEQQVLMAIKECVTVARRIERAEHQRITAAQQDAWFKQHAEALEIELDDDLLVCGKNEEKDQQKKRDLQQMKRRLQVLMSKPCFDLKRKTCHPTKLGMPPTFGASTAKGSALATLRQDVRLRKRRKVAKGIVGVGT